MGIGYRADVKGKIATFTLGYSHPIEVLLPEGVDLKIDKQTHLVLSGHDKQLIGQVAANIRGAAQTGSVQEQGRPLHGRSAEEEGRQVAARPEARSKINDSQDFEKRDPRARSHPHSQEAAAALPSGRASTVFRSTAHIYAQVIDDTKGVTLVAASSTEKTRTKSTGGNVAAAKEIGKRVAERAKENGINKVVFDRGGYIYHGRVKALADAAREAGLEF